MRSHRSQNRLRSWSFWFSLSWSSIAVAVAAGCSSAPGPRLSVDESGGQPDAGDAGAGLPPTCPSTAGFSGRVGPACGAGVSNKGPCTAGVDQPCVNTCGPVKSGVKNCTCLSTGTWDCPICEYDPDPALAYACYRRPPAGAASLCPPADTGSLIKSGDPCTQAACMACGSDTTPTYLDGSNAMKAGFCVCSAVDPATPGKWSCASVKEWPPACLTDR